jgi:hypothetical protein
MIERRTLFIAVLGCLCGCVHRGNTVTPAQSSLEPDGIGADSIAIVRVVGEEIRRTSRKALPVMRGIAQTNGAQVALDPRATAIANALSVELARSMSVQVISPGSGKDTGFDQLIGVAITSDSGWVDIFQAPAMRPGDAYFFTALRYQCRRSVGGWIFVRRDILLAS